jgi:epoxyqueuosine reductase
MSGTDELWAGVLRTLAQRGWSAAVVAAERLEQVHTRVAGILASDALPAPTAEHLGAETAVKLPESVAARSVIVAATTRPLTQAQLTVSGSPHRVPVPPHYAGYATVPLHLVRTAAEALARAGYVAQGLRAPLKTLAVGAGLARYGRNNLAYVPGLGSYLLLAACVSDAPPPHGAPWHGPRMLRRCRQCQACLRACPSGALAADRFLLHTERCLTYANEDTAAFPDWVDPAWHTCAVGCLRCQQVCPENADVNLVTTPPEQFDDDETAAILNATPHTELAAATLAKLERCGLDYSPQLIARNLAALLGASPASER